jgi:Pregnancy-associated plasma protein-A
MMKASKNLFGRLLLAAAVGTVALAGCAPEDDTSTDTGALKRRCAQEELTMAEQDAVEFRTFGVASTDGEDVLDAKSYDVKRDIVFPVHVLIVDAGGPVTDAQVIEQIKVLNDSYSGATGGYDTRIRFDLETVERTTQRYVDVAYGSANEAAAKKILFDKYPGANRLRIVFTSLEDGLLGWATFPFDYEAKPAMDGLMVLSASLPGGSAAPYNEGDTLTHEVGHWVGLYHTFQNGCNAPGDSVKDTPRVASPNFEAPPVGSVDSCKTGPGTLPNLPDLTQNFMDYTDDVAMDSFTHHQAWRAGWMTAKYRTDAVVSTDE